MMAAALALLMAGGAAMALTQEEYDATFTKEQDYAIKTTMLANFAGSPKRNRCPQFRVIDEATNAELAAAGVTLEMLRTLRDIGGADTGPFTARFIDEYNKDPSNFCHEAWRALGPNGTYKRQMLEAK
jgi:hypothetical protein